MKKIYYIALLLIIAISSCSKKPEKVSPVNVDTKGKDTLDRIKDSVYLYTKEEYLWYDQLPTYDAFKPRSYVNAEDATALSNELDALSQFAINPSTGKPYELSLNYPGTAKYSFIDDGAVSGEINGTNGDFGFQLQWDDPSDLSDLRVIYVYPGSPADLKGLNRGDKITSINGRTSLSYDASGYGNGSGNNLNFVINAFTNSNTISMTVSKHDGTSKTITNMAVANYTINPVLKSTVLNLPGGKKVGYLVFNVFTDPSNAGPKLDAAFSKFAGITDLVVDLRYNGGGSVATAEYLDNLIVPPAYSGSLMYTAYYNSQLQKDIHPLLSTQYNISPGDFKPINNTAYFAKKGSLNINRVFFIITGNTASASELTINNLRPHMDVQYIGNTSYGKPVGFFAIDINKYQLYTPEFETKNSANQGGYYDGFTPEDPGFNGKLANDDERTDFGDPNEGMLSQALSYIETGNYTAANNQSTQSFGPIKKSFSLADKREMLLKLNPHKFFGMVGNKIGNKTLKPKRHIR